MKRFLLILFALFFFTLFPGMDAQAEESPNGNGAVLCLPGNYAFTVTDCKPSGPSAYQTEVAEFGISLPEWSGQYH